MLTKYDISRLQDISIESVAEALNITVYRHKAICPFHEDTRPSLTFNTRKNTFRCYVCNTWGDCIDLVVKSQGWTFYESCKWLARQFGISLENDDNFLEFRQIKQQVKHVKRDPPPMPIDVHYLENLIREPYLCEEARRFLFEERKISPWVVQQHGLSSISQPTPMSGNVHDMWFNAPSLLIPYRDIEGKLLSVQARYLGHSPFKGETERVPRFQFPRGSKCGIFNLPILRPLTEGSELWITEGVSDCLSMMSYGRKAIAIPSATLLSDADKQLLSTLSSELSTEFHMSPDNDAPGDKLFQELKKILPQLEHHLLPAKFKDFGEYYLSQVGEPVEPQC